MDSTNANISHCDKAKLSELAMQLLIFYLLTYLINIAAHLTYVTLVRLQ